MEETIKIPGFARRFAKKREAKNSLVKHSKKCEFSPMSDDATKPKGLAMRKSRWLGKGKH